MLCVPSLNTINTITYFIFFILSTVYFTLIGYAIRRRFFVLFLLNLVSLPPQHVVLRVTRCCYSFLFSADYYLFNCERLCQLTPCIYSCSFFNTVYCLFDNIVRHVIRWYSCCCKTVFLFVLLIVFLSSTILIIVVGLSRRSMSIFCFPFFSTSFIVFSTMWNVTSVDAN